MNKYKKTEVADEEIIKAPFPFPVVMKRRNLSRKFIIDQELDPINPLQCGKQECPPAYSYGPRIRNIWIIHFVISGKGKVIKKGVQYDVHENEIFVIRPFETTTYTADIDEPWQYIWIGFTAKTLPTVLEQSDVIYAPYLKDMFLSAYYTDDFETPSASGAYEHYLCGIIWQIFGRLIQNTKNNSSVYDNYVKPAITLMNIFTSDTSLNVTNIANQLHITPEHLSRIFKSETGLSPKKYLNDIRMKKAIEYISKANTTVLRTAEAVGFSDAFTFSRAFKRYYGCSPSEYIKKNQT